VLERYLLFPLLAGWALNRSGDYASADRWFRRLYDPFGASKKEVFPFTKIFGASSPLPSYWYADATNPHAIAMRRAGAYLRHVMLMLAKNLLDWAEHDLAFNDPESRNRARELFVTAKALLGAPELDHTCDDELVQLVSDLAEGFSQTDATAEVSVQRLFEDIVNKLQSVKDREVFETAVRRIRSLFDRDFPYLAAFVDELEAIVREALAEAAKSKEGKILPLSQGYGDIEIQVKRRDDEDDEEEAAIKFLKNMRQRMIPVDRASLGTALFSDLCVPPNPLVRIYADRAEFGLAVIRQCFDSNGEPQLLPFGSLFGRAIETFADIEGYSIDRRSIAPRYRYGFLAEKARQYASLAQQLEASMLSAIEKRDSAALAMLQAEIAKEVANATATLKQSAFAEAALGVDVASIQSLQATHQKTFWTKRTTDTAGSNGLNLTELTGLGLMVGSGILQATAALGHILLAGPAGAVAYSGATTAAAGATGGTASSPTGVGALAGYITAALGGAATAAAIVAGGNQVLSGIQAGAGALGTFGQFALTTASFQRRWEDWLLAAKLADYGEQISAKQLELAKARKATLKLDKAIADLQEAHAGSVVKFHTVRFSNEELYQWMIGVLQDAYRNVMQSATEMALQAQSALQFERQQSISEVQGDYWSIDEATLTEEQKLSGLTGAERLQAALTRLDEWKVNTDKRRLQLSKTISLARYMPADFATRFRQTGRIDFYTLIDWFDWDFPGHYLRLIKSVKVTVIALVPPTEGIHATLSNNGMSSVVLKEAGGGFVKVPGVVTRFPESVALDSPYNDSGLFVLDYRDPMLLPFEGLGVETGWTFEMPTATNRFDYDTLADVLFTIEYTALASDLYKEQVIERLGTTQGMDLVHSLRGNYQDAWYHLMNPQDPAQVQTVVINLPQRSFPKSSVGDGRPGLEHLTVLMIGDNCANLPGLDNLKVSVMKKGLTSKFQDTNTKEVRANPDGRFNLDTDKNGAFSTRNHSIDDGNDMPQTVFAVDPSDQTVLLHPKDVPTDADPKLLDPAGEWEFVFDPNWFAGNYGSRPIAY